MRFASTLKTVTTAICAGVFALSLSSSANAQQAAAKISGEGVIGADSVTAGAPFTIDIWLSNGAPQKGFTLGFAISGKDGLKSIKHAWSSNPGDSAFNPTTNNLLKTGGKKSAIEIGNYIN